MMIVIKNTIHNQEVKYGNCFKSTTTGGLIASLITLEEYSLI